MVFLPPFGQFSSLDEGENARCFIKLFVFYHWVVKK